MRNEKQDSVGIELELQIINPNNGHLTSRAKDLIRQINTTKYAPFIKPEVTQCMIELNSSPFVDVHHLLAELRCMKLFMKEVAQEFKIGFAGGGTHPFGLWRHRKIFPSQRFKKLFNRQGYLAKQLTVFSQHIHIGCANGDEAIYLSNALTRYIPQFIALSASSPFYQGTDTRFDSARSNVITAFPTSGPMPFFKNWQQFVRYFEKLRRFKIIESIKDIYWDVRPKAETQTIEIRVNDTPLTIEKTATIAAYAQALCRYLLRQKSSTTLLPCDSMIYNHNRFQAIRYGFDGIYIDPYTEKQSSIGDEILSTIDTIQSEASVLNSQDFLSQLKNDVLAKENDAKWLREAHGKVGCLKKLAIEQSHRWMQ